LRRPGDRFMNMKPLLYFEDMLLGDELLSPAVVVEREELIAFAKIWDPMPFHFDELAGRNAFGTITAPGSYALALKQRLMHQLPSGTR
jgi:acyl dehydratase